MLVKALRLQLSELLRDRIDADWDSEAGAGDNGGDNGGGRGGGKGGGKGGARLEVPVARAPVPGGKGWPPPMETRAQAQAALLSALVWLIGRAGGSGGGDGDEGAPAKAPPAKGGGPGGKGGGGKGGGRRQGRPLAPRVQIGAPPRVRDAVWSDPRARSAAPPTQTCVVHQSVPLDAARAHTAQQDRRCAHLSRSVHSTKGAGMLGRGITRHKMCV